MKINAPMLFHNMKKYFNVDYTIITANNYVKTPIFYNVFFDMDEHIVLCTADNIEKCIKKVNRSIIICLDHVDNITDSGSNDLIVLNDTMSEKMAFNIVNYILDIYNEWEIELVDIIYNKHDFNMLLNSINRIIELPIALFDANFRYIAYSDDSNTAELLQYVDEKKQIPKEQVNAMYSHPEFAKLSSRKEAFFYQADVDNVFKNIFHNGNYVARLAVLINTEQDDIDYIISICDTSAPFVETLYSLSTNYAYTSEEYLEIHKHLENIINGKIVERKNFIEVISKMNCKETDEWQAFYLTIHNPTQLMYSISYTCFQIENNFPGTFCINYNDNIYCLCDLTRYKEVTGEEFKTSFIKYVKDSMLIAGVSRIINDYTYIDNIYIALIHAKFALDNSNDLNSGEFALFDNNALDYLLLYGSNNLTAEQICHPALLKLMDYDNKHSTSYSYTLYMYMQNNMNAVATAKQLFIHRSSFINRMERIHELIDIDLNDPKDRLYLSVSFNRYYKEPEV